MIVITLLLITLTAFNNLLLDIDLSLGDYGLLWNTGHRSSFSIH